MALLAAHIEDSPQLAMIGGASHEVHLLYQEHYQSLVRLASFMLDDRGACEEVVQDAFVKTLAGWGRITDSTKAPAYLRSAVLNGARSRLRRRAVVRRHPDPPPGEVGPADAGAVDHRLIIDELRRLPDRQRESLVLRFYLDLSEAEIAETMGVSAGSVKTHLHRGLAALNRRLEGTR